MLSLVFLSGPLVMVGVGVTAFISNFKHLLNTLLSLEFLMLGIFWLLGQSSACVGSEIYFSLFFLTLAACEGALGLTLLILIVRSHGSDEFSSFNLLEC